jgi:hypothetical protein
VLRPGAAHGSLPRQFGAGEIVVVTDQTILHTDTDCRREARPGDWMPAYAGMTFYWGQTYETDM